METRSSFSRVLTVGEVAARCGVAVSTLHFYEAQGLIHSWRNRGNQRRYPREVLRRVAVIKVAQRTGIPLAEIRAALTTLPDERTPTAEDWKRLSTSWRADLDHRIACLTGLRDQLDGCIGCGCLSLGICPLRNPSDRLGEEGPGPRLLDPGASEERRHKASPGTARRSERRRPSDESCRLADIRNGESGQKGRQEHGDRVNSGNSRRRHLSGRARGGRDTGHKG